MAMAFAPAALKVGTLRIADPQVVSKSYPEYWTAVADCLEIIK
jgi:3-phosphoshikimate 1-carboxyvinyltransferase